MNDVIEDLDNHEQSKNNNNIFDNGANIQQIIVEAKGILIKVDDDNISKLLKSEYTGLKNYMKSTKSSDAKKREKYKYDNTTKPFKFGGDAEAMAGLFFTVIIGGPLVIAYFATMYSIFAIPYTLICLSNIVHDQLYTKGGNKKTKKKLYKRKYKRNLTIMRKRKLRSIK
jgi:hypothetical protein